MIKHSPVLTETDRRRLTAMTDSLREQWGSKGGAVSILEQRINAAEPVEADKVGPGVVTMNSRIQVLDLVTGRRHVVIPSYPMNSDGMDERVSVLTPFGAALLGAKVGEEIEWTHRYGIRRVRIEAVVYQPEAAGDFHL